MSQRPILNLSAKYVFGLTMQYQTASTILIESGAARDSENITDLVVDNDLTANILGRGVNGLDSGTVQNNTFYAVYVIGDSSKHNPEAVTFSTSFDAPTYPAGYDAHRRVGAILTITPDIKSFVQYGSGADRYMYYSDAISLLAAGTAGAFTAILAGAAIPPVRCQALLQVNADPDARAEFRPPSSPSVNGVVVLSGRDTISVPADVVSGGAVTEYRLTSAGGTNVDVDAAGYIDQL